MKSLKFIKFFLTLTASEQTQFHKHLRKMHAGEVVALEVFIHIKRLYAGKKAQPKFDTDQAARSLFPTEYENKSKGAQKKLLNALADLHQWLREFLLLEQIRTEAPEADLLWLRMLRERGLKDEFGRQAIALYNHTQKAADRTVAAYLSQSTAYLYYYLYHSAGKTHANIEAMESCLEGLTGISEIIRLRIACNIANSKRVLDPESRGIRIDRSPDHVDPVLAIYREILGLQETGNEQHFTAVKKLLVTHAAQITADELHGMLSYLHNYVATQVRIGKEAEFSPILHELNQFGLKHNFFTHKEPMSVAQFTNIVNTACSVKDFSWTKGFIRAQLPLLPTDIQEETKILTDAMMFFEQDEFRKASDLLENKETKDPVNIIRARALLLRCYYDLRKEEDKDKMLDYSWMFESWLRRRRTRKNEAIEAMLKFVHMWRALVEGKRDKQKLLEQIKAAKPLYFKPWLLKKAEGY